MLGDKFHIIYFFASLVLPFVVAFAIRIFTDKWENENNQGKKTSGASKADGSSNNFKDNKYSRGGSNDYEYSSRFTYKSWEEEKKIIFNKKAGSYISVDSTLYKATLSVIALFSWVIRKDGSIGKLEMEVARSYFESHPIYSDILTFSPKDKGNDPISNSPRQYMENCMDLLNYYNRSSKLLRYEKCCQYIKEADIYYIAAFDLIKALCQVAYSSDGVIDSEAELLCGLANELHIHREDWLNLMQIYGIGTGTGRKKKHGSSRRYYRRENDNTYEQKREKDDQGENQEEKWSDDQQENRNQENQGNQENRQKSSTFGFKLTQAYNELGLLTTASEAEIKEAYRTLVKKYHPDRLPPDATDQERKISADQFRQVKEAYDLIRLERGR